MPGWHFRLNGLQPTLLRSTRAEEAQIKVGNTAKSGVCTLFSSPPQLLRAILELADQSKQKLAHLFQGSRAFGVQF